MLRLAHHLLGCQSSSSPSPSVTLWFWGGSFGLERSRSPVTGFHSALRAVQPAERVRKVRDTCAHICPRMQIHSHACLHILTSAAFSPHTAARTQAQQNAHFPPSRTCTRWHTRVCPPAQPVQLPHLAHKQAGICHRGSHIHSRARARRKDEHTQAHTAVLLSGASVPF